MVGFSLFGAMKINAAFECPQGTSMKRTLYAGQKDHMAKPIH